jgi:hypothetical protein
MKGNSILTVLLVTTALFAHPPGRDRPGAATDPTYLSVIATASTRGAVLKHRVRY